LADLFAETKADSMAVLVHRLTRIVRGLKERFENVFQIDFAYANALVLDTYLDCDFVFAGLYGQDCNEDYALAMRELNSVAEQIDQDLLRSHPVKLAQLLLQIGVDLELYFFI
jgi:hypothetical protein